MNIRQTGPGRATVFGRRADYSGAAGIIYNFDVNGITLKERHWEWLDMHVMPTLRVRVILIEVGDQKHTVERRSIIRIDGFVRRLENRFELIELRHLIYSTQLS